MKSNKKCSHVRQDKTMTSKINLRWSNRNLTCNLFPGKGIVGFYFNCNDKMESDLYKGTVRKMLNDFSFGFNNNEECPIFWCLFLPLDKNDVDSRKLVSFDYEMNIEIAKENLLASAKKMLSDVGFSAEVK